MPAKKQTQTGASAGERKPTTVEARESEMISLAINLAEEQLRNGTASSQVITHYLKLGSTKERIEREIMERERDLLDAKRKTIENSEHAEEMYERAIEAMKRYSGGLQNGN